MTDRPPHELEPTVAAEVAGADSTIEPIPSIAPRAHELVAGRYEILGLLGTGGMGTVYRARDTELDEVVALKVLRTEALTSLAVERFRREVKLARRVTHTNVARVFDIGEHQGARYLTMELIDGESLATRLARERMLGLEDAIGVISSVAAGLTAIHAAGVVHRDLKPDNVLVAKDGRVVIADFGIARAFEVDEGATATSNLMIGTPAYMAPEQVEGRGDIDARADVYALGAMLYELSTGLRPFRGDVPIAVAAARLLDPPPDPRLVRHDLPDAFAEVILRCMQLRREDRFASAELVASALAAVTLSSLPAVRPIQPSRAEATPGREKSVAVLPFVNGGAAEDDYIADELSDDLIDALSMTSKIRVSSRGLVARFRGKNVDPREVGRELGVQVVVDGKVRRAAGRVRVSARISSVADGFLLWVKRFDRPESELLAVSDEVARAIAFAITEELAGGGRSVIADPVALDLYLRARHEYRNFWPASLQRSVVLFEAALERAPGTSALLVGRALARARLAFSDVKSLPRAREDALEALRVAPESPEAHLAVASVELQHGNLATAVRELKFALTRSPGLAEAHSTLGRILVEAGALDEGIEHLETALARDPLVALARSQLARTYALIGEHAKSGALLDVDRREDDDGSYDVFRARIALWRKDPGAAEKIVHALRMNKEFLPHPLVQVASVAMDDLVASVPQHVGTLIRIATTTNDSPRRRVFFAQLAAEISSAYEEHEVAMEALRAAADLGLFDVVWMDHLRLFDGYRARPEWAELRAVVAARGDAILEAYRNA